MPEALKYDAIDPSSAIYPEALKDVFGHFAAPKVFAIGNVGLLKQFSVGFCGSRNATDQGIKVALDCADQLARLGIVVVSGYARGVDTVAHHTALSSGGATVIVLPEGIEHFRVRQDLREHWDWERVLVVSQFEPDAIWRADRAMERNKLIITLSDATIVIEAGETGGTLNAGMIALRLEKPLFVANYSTADQTAPGNVALLKHGGSPLNRSKRTGRAEIGPVVAAISASKTSSQAI